MQMQHQSLASVLLPEYRRRILGLLLLHPDEALHGREIARRTGLPAGSVARELRRLSDVGLLRRQRRGNQQVYCAETTSPVYDELASILRKTSGLADVLAQSLAPLASRIHSAFVFGSIAQGRGVAGSDVDILLIGDIGFSEAVEALYPAQSELGREVNPKVYSRQEFVDEVIADSFLRDVISKPRIFVIGSEYELAELIGHQPRRRRA